MRVKIESVPQGTTGKPFGKHAQIKVNCLALIEKLGRQGRRQITVNEAIEALGYSRSAIYGKIAQFGIPIQRIAGRSTIDAISFAEKCIEELEADTNGERSFAITRDMYISQQMEVKVLNSKISMLENKLNEMAEIKAVLEQLLAQSEVGRGGSTRQGSASSGTEPSSGRTRAARGRRTWFSQHVTVPAVDGTGAW